ncbi:MAG: response regulator transcription factor [Planctomycetota bacterium]|jgi:FixJ family two-component response regulator
MTKIPTVFVVDDDPTMRHSMSRLLQEVNIHVQTFATARDFLNVYDPEQPGCLVVDVQMPGMSGIDVHKHLVAKGHTIPVIIATGHADVPMAVDALKRGAFDFLEKPLRAQPLLDLVRRALKKDEEDRRQVRDKQALRDRYAKLTEREIEVIDFIVKGLTNKAIAHELGVSSQAIDARRARAMEKLKVASVPELVQIAVKVREWQ